MLKSQKMKKTYKQDTNSSVVNKYENEKTSIENKNTNIQDNDKLKMLKITT